MLLTENLVFLILDAEVTKNQTMAEWPVIPQKTHKKEKKKCIWRKQ